MKFEYDWLDAPGVKDKVLAASWARLGISINGSNLTELLDVEADTRRASVFGPLFPLVEWLVENWWHLLHEPSLIRPLRSGREAPEWARNWFQRHNLLAAREGTALPDATFVRDGDEIIVKCFPDPPRQDIGRVRFLASHEVRLPAHEFERTASVFIKHALSRVRAVVGEKDDDLSRVTALWSEIKNADVGEQRLCRALAILGADPYDPGEASDSLVPRLQRLFLELPEVLLDDLLEGTDSRTLPAVSDWIAGKKGLLANGFPHPPYPSLHISWSASAHQTGYELAHRVRKELLGVSPEEPIHDLESLLVSRLGWNAIPKQPVDQVIEIEGLVGLASASSRPILLTSGRSEEITMERFRLARAAFFTASGTVGGGRLLTKAVTPAQRAGRAFAAELLAPSSALSKRISGRVSDMEVAALSKEFEVSSRLIEHQIENHRIGWVEQ